MNNFCCAASSTGVQMLWRGGGRGSRGTPRCPRPPPRPGARVGVPPLPLLPRGLPPPRRAGPRPPQDAPEDAAVVVGRSAYPAPLRRQQQGTHQGPSLVCEPRFFGSDRGGLGRPFSVPSAALAARLAARQRTATAWCARLHDDHPSSRKRRCSSGSAIASTRRRTSGTVGGSRPGPRSPLHCPFPCLPPHAQLLGRRPERRRGPAGTA